MSAAFANDPGFRTARHPLTARLAAVCDVGDRRAADRVEVALDARVRPLGEEGSEARIVNLSATGFMAATGAHYDVGARVWLILPTGDRATAIVKWTAGDKIGAEFAEPLPLGALAIALR